MKRKSWVPLKVINIFVCPHAALFHGQMLSDRPMTVRMVSACSMHSVACGVCMQDNQYVHVFTDNQYHIRRPSM